MDGILCINKPQGWTSFDVVAKMRGIAGTRRMGHAGTLDPMATGVLPLFIGGATRFHELLPCQDKRYRAGLRLGVETDTQDITGKVLRELPVHCTFADVKAALEGFAGEISQQAPAYSAVQVDGRRLYDLARQGIEVPRPFRQVTIYSATLCEAEGGEYSLDVHCSKGTYIRTLCHDLGQKLGCGGALSSLERTMAAGFTLEDCITLEQAQELRDAGLLKQRLLPIDSAFRTLPEIRLNAHFERLFKNGVRLRPQQIGLKADGMVRVYGAAGNFLGLASADPESDRVIIEKLFVSEVRNA